MITQAFLKSWASKSPRFRFNSSSNTEPPVAIALSLSWFHCLQIQGHWLLQPEDQLLSWSKPMYLPLHKHSQSLRLRVFQWTLAISTVGRKFLYIQLKIGMLGLVFLTLAKYGEICSLWWFRSEWPQRLICLNACLLTSCWLSLRRIRRCGLGRSVSLGVGFDVPNAEDSLSIFSFCCVSTRM